MFAVMASFGENVKRLRERVGLARAKTLAKSIGVAPSVVSRWENDKTGLPEGPTLLKLAKVLDCSLDDLLDGVDPARIPG